MQAQLLEYSLQVEKIEEKTIIQDPEQLILQLAKKLGSQVQTLLQNIKNYRNQTGSYQKYGFPTIVIKKQKTKSTVCAKILSKGSKAFKCHQCMFEANSIICVECFQKSDHKGHMFEIIQVFGGCCDCGDQEKWDVKGSCCDHKNSDILEQIQIDPSEKASFTTLYRFAIYYLLHIYQKVHIQKNEQKKTKIIEQVKGYGLSLFQHLYKFNVDSLISNIMTTDLLTQGFDTIYPNLHWLNKINLSKRQSQLNLIQIIFQLLQVPQIGDILVNLLTSLFTIKEFKKFLTIVFCQKYSSNPQFAMGPYNHLSCQLLTSHKIIQSLIEQQKILPLKFQGDAKKIKSFEQIAQNFVRFYVDIEYLSKLHENSGEIYVTYHIMKGNISSLAGYRQFSYKYDDAINFFGIELIYINKMFKIVQKVKKNDQVLIKGIRDLFDYVVSTKEVKSGSPTVYLSQERALSMFIFALFQNNKASTFEENIKKIIEILGLNQRNSLQVLDPIFKLLNYNIQQSALVLGHPQSYDRFYTYYCFTFKKNMMSLSLDFYLYKVLTYILKHFNIVKASQVGDFIKTLLNVENLFQANDFKDDDESIFDRRKCMLSLYYFLNLMIQLSETSIHELIIGMKIRPQNYSKQAVDFYLNLIKTYKKTSIKDIKGIIDSFFQNNQLFQKFISSNENISIQAGKVSIREDCAFNNQGINANYLKCFKNKLINLQEVFSAEYKPSSNSFSLFIFDTKYIEKAIEVAVAYRNIIIMRQGRIKQKQCGVVCQYIKQLLKLQYCLRNNQQISQLFMGLFKALAHDKKSLELFDPQLIKQLTLAEEYSKKLHQNMKEEQKTRQEDRKQRLLAKKSRKIAKFKQAHEKIAVNFKQQLKCLQTQIVQQRNQNYEGCIICRQNKLVDNDLMLMGYMQNSDLYYQYLKGKKQNEKNYNMVFKTCGHQIHMNCHVKINGGREYSTCQLCKSTVNSLFPIRVQQVKLSQHNQKGLEDKLIGDIKENITRLSIINVVIEEKCQNGFGVQFQDKRGIEQQLIESFVNQFIFSGLLHEGFFIKKQLPVYSNILKSLKIFFKKNKPQFQILKKKSENKEELSSSQSFEMNDQKQQEFQRILQHLEICIRSKLNSYFFDQEPEKLQLDISQNFIAKINYIFSVIQQNKTQNSSQIQSFQSSPCTKKLKEKISFFEFPQNLQILIQQIGKCPNCSNFTNMVMICVLCSWHGCRGCKQQSVIDHTHKKHNGNSVFVQGDNGCIYFVSRKKYWLYYSVYEDYLGDSYGGYSPGIKLYKYVKSQKKIKQIFNDIVQHQIEQKIRYQQYTKKKSFTQAI